MDTQTRRSFLGRAAGGLAGAGLGTGLLAAGSASESANGAGLARAQPAGAGHEGDGHRGACVIASGNGLVAVSEAMARIGGGSAVVDAVVEGVSLVEADPEDRSVGLGGLPNEDGVVQLDASVMDGPTHKAGAVAALEDTLEAAKVALTVLKRTDHVLIVGEGAKRFARSHGFGHTDMLTEETRRIWMRWKENGNPNDDRLDADQMDWNPDGTVRVSSMDDAGGRTEPIFTYGTINCSGVSASGEVASCTTTSGLSYKIPGRVGDSPIVGAGMFVDNAVGAAGATGRGEAVIQNCGAFSVVREMERGLSPTEACLEVLRRMTTNTRQKRLLDVGGLPNYNVTFYAVRKDGAYGSACMLPGGNFAVHDGERARRLASVPLHGA